METVYSKIGKLTNINMWRNCLGNFNPADLPSRGTTATDFYNLSSVNNGPTFLRQSMNTWLVDISVTDLSMSEDEKVVNVVECISSKDIKTLLIFVNTVQLIAYFVLQHLYCVLFQI